MAEQIERNGARLYRALAAASDDEHIRGVFEHLAQWEDGHESLFARMRASLADSSVLLVDIDTDGTADMYLRTMADQHVFPPGTPIEPLLAEARTTEDALRLALRYEGDSILFFLGMMRVVPDQMGRGQIDELIEEERRHIAYLGNEFAKAVSVERSA